MEAGNTAAAIWKNERSRGVYGKQHHQHGKYPVACAQRQTFPVFQQKRSGKAGEKSAGQRKSQNGIQTDVAADAEKLPCVVPVAFIKECVKQPACKQFHNGADAGGIEEAEQRAFSFGVE